MTRNWRTIPSALVAVVVGASAAGAVTIADILASPSSYNGQTVTVVGTVAAVLPVGAESGYDLRDGAAKVSVVSRSAAPSAGASLSVTAKVHALPFDDEEGTQLPPYLEEQSRAPGP